jgi:hypothetical protein
MALISEIVFWLLIVVLVYSVAAVIAFLRFLALKTSAPSPVLRGLRILFVIAHPDDECMFFTPTILDLKRKNSIHILSLSTGVFSFPIRRQDARMVDSDVVFDTQVTMTGREQSGDASLCAVR